MIIGNVYLFDAATRDYFSYWIAHYPDQLKIVYDKFIRRSKAQASLRGTSETNWDTYVRVLCYRGPDKNVSYRSIKNPSATPISEVVAVTHIPYQFVTGQGTGYFNLNFNPNGNATYLQDDAGIFAKCEEDAAVLGVYCMGAKNGSNQGSFLNPRTTSDNIATAVNGSAINAGSGGTTTHSNNLTSSRRIASANVITQKDGLTTTGNQFTNSNTSVSVPSLNWYGLTRNSNGSVVSSEIDPRPYSWMGVTNGYCNFAALKAHIDLFEAELKTLLNLVAAGANYILAMKGQSNCSGPGIGADFSAVNQAVIPNTKVTRNLALEPLQMGVNNKNSPNGNGGHECPVCYQLQAATGKEIVLTKRDQGGTQIYKEADDVCTDSLTISTGGKSFNTGAGHTWNNGTRIRLTSGANYIEGNASSYNNVSGATVLGVDTAVGSGTFSSWVVSVVDWNPDSVNELDSQFLNNHVYVGIDYYYSNARNCIVEVLVSHGEEDGNDNTVKAPAYFANIKKDYLFINSSIYNYVQTNYPGRILPPIHWIFTKPVSPSTPGSGGDTVRAAMESLKALYPVYVDTLEMLVAVGSPPVMQTATDVTYEGVHFISSKFEEAAPRIVTKMLTHHT
jgi:hypothetical protein